MTNQTLERGRTRRRSSRRGPRSRSRVWRATPRTAEGRGEAGARPRPGTDRTAEGSGGGSSRRAGLGVARRRPEAEPGSGSGGRRAVRRPRRGAGRAAFQIPPRERSQQPGARHRELRAAPSRGLPRRHDHRGADAGALPQGVGAEAGEPGKPKIPPPPKWDISPCGPARRPDRPMPRRRLQPAAGAYARP